MDQTRHCISKVIMADHIALDLVPDFMKKISVHLAMTLLPLILSGTMHKIQGLLDFLIEKGHAMRRQYLVPQVILILRML